MQLYHFPAVSLFPEPRMWTERRMTVSVPDSFGPRTEIVTLITVSVPHDGRFGPTINRYQKIHKYTKKDLAKVLDYNMVYSQGLPNDKKVG